jgi:hypothetical protein
MEALGDGDVGRCWWHAGEGFSVEGFAGGREVEVVLLAASGDVDVGLGPGGGGIDPAGGDGAGRALHGVAGDGVGVIDADFGSVRPVGESRTEAGCS